MSTTIDLRARDANDAPIVPSDPRAGILGYEPRAVATADGWTLDGARVLDDGPLEVRCDIGLASEPRYDSMLFDLRIGDVTYIGAHIHGDGGRLTGDPARFAAWMERALFSGRVLMIWTRLRAPNEHDLRFHAAAELVEVIRAYRARPLPERVRESRR